MVREIQTAVRASGPRIRILNASSERDLDKAFSTIAQEKIGALLVSPDPLFSNIRVQLVARASNHSVPTIFAWREFAEVGGLMSYGTQLTDVQRQCAIYVGRILKGVKPADLPVLQPTKFELVINLKTAKALGLTVPPTLIARADEVIE